MRQTACPGSAAGHPAVMPIAELIGPIRSRRVSSSTSHRARFRKLAGRIRRRWIALYPTAASCQETPKRSLSHAKRGLNGYASSGISICPPSESPAKSASTSASVSQVT